MCSLLRCTHASCVLPLPSDDAVAQSGDIFPLPFLCVRVLHRHRYQDLQARILSRAPLFAAVGMHHAARRARFRMYTSTRRSAWQCIEPSKIARICGEHFLMGKKKSWRVMSAGAEPGRGWRGGWQMCQIAGISARPAPRLPACSLQPAAAKLPPSCKPRAAPAAPAARKVSAGPGGYHGGTEILHAIQCIHLVPADAVRCGAVRRRMAGEVGAAQSGPTARERGGSESILHVAWLFTPDYP